MNMPAAPMSALVATPGVTTVPGPRRYACGRLIPVGYGRSTGDAGWVELHELGCRLRTTLPASIAVECWATWDAEGQAYRLAVAVRFDPEDQPAAVIAIARALCPSPPAQPGGATWRR